MEWKFNSSAILNNEKMAFLGGGEGDLKNKTVKTIKRRKCIKTPFLQAYKGKFGCKIYSRFSRKIFKESVIIEYLRTEYIQTWITKK